MTRRPLAGEEGVAKEVRAESPRWISSVLGTGFTSSGVLRTDKLTWLSRVLSLAGFAIAAYLTTVYLADVPPVCLGGSSGCVTVQHSSYAHLAGIPLPLFGLAGYLLLFISACLPGQRARTAGMAFTVFAIAASAVLTYLELNVIHAICYWCVASAVCATFHLIVNSIRYVRGEPRLAYLGTPAVQ